jgi:hypothetical protein
MLLPLERHLRRGLGVVTRLRSTGEDVVTQLVVGQTNPTFTQGGPHGQVVLRDIPPLYLSFLQCVHVLV